MMGYDLCLLQQAQHPYYIENIRTNIYSLEELCFYLYNNMCLIDKTIVNEKLCTWVRDELHLTRLYHLLCEQLERPKSAAYFVVPIFREAGYLTNQEMHRFQEDMERLEAQSAEMKRKLRGDSFVRGKLYASAAWEYRQLLKEQDPGRLGTPFYASVWNNLGAAYAGLFQFKEAADCFWESYSLLNTKETFRKYISALPLFLSEEDYQARLKELEADEYLVHSIQEYNARLCETPEFLEYSESVRSRPVSDVLEDLKEQYVRSTQT